MNRAILRLMLAGLLAALMPGGPRAQAQTYPRQTVQIVVPFPPGGLVDAAARFVQPELERALGRPVIIENRPGAGGAVATAGVARAEPDGHTLLMVSSTHSVLPAINPNLSYDVERDLAPVAIVAKDPLLFVINNDVKANTLQEFIAVARAEPGKLNYATPGFGTLAHMMSELLAQRAGIKIQHVPYRGGAAAIQGTMTGQSQLAILSAQVSIPQIEGGTVRAVAIGSLVRDPKVPTVPTLAESGFPGWEATQWVGLLAPRGTPAEVIARLNAIINEAIRKPEVARLIATQGMTPSGGSPELFHQTIQFEVKQWREVARAANIKPE